MPIMTTDEVFEIALDVLTMEMDARRTTHDDFGDQRIFIKALPALIELLEDGQRAFEILTRVEDRAVFKFHLALAAQIVRAAQ